MSFITDIGFALAAFGTIFAIVNPMDGLPIYLAITKGVSVKNKQRIVNRACTASFSILVVFAIAGRYVFEIYDLSLYAFEIAGGIFLFASSWDVLTGKSAMLKITEEAEERAIIARDKLTIVPLAMPMLAGPGAITTVILYIGNAGSDIFRLASIFVAIGLTMIGTWITLKYADKIVDKIGETVTDAITRILGILIGAVAIQFILSGISGWFHV